MAIYLAKRWRRQPIGDVGVNWGHPSARGLTFLMNGARGTNQMNLVNRSAGTNTGSPTGSNHPPGGRAFETLATTEYVTFEASANLFGTAEASCLIFHRKTDTTNRVNTTFSHDIANAAVVNAERFLCNAPWSDGTTYFDFGGSAGNNRVSAAGIDYSTPRCQIFAGGTAGLRIVTDGAINASSSTAVTRSSSTGNFGLLWNAGGASADLQQIFCVAVWKRDIQAAEAQELTRNPWQLFAPLTAKIYSFSAAAPGASPQWPSSLALTGTGY